MRWWGGAIVRSPWSVVRRKSYGLRTTDYGLGSASSGVLCPVVVLSLPFFALHMPRTVPAKTPAALHLPFEEIRFRTQDGLELAGWLVPHEHAPGSMIFCHGHGQNRGQVLGCLQILHELQLDVLAFDFRGHGDSPGHTETFGQREVHDLIAADTYMRQRFPQPVFLMGVSYGCRGCSAPHIAARKGRLEPIQLQPLLYGRGKELLLATGCPPSPYPEDLPDDGMGRLWPLGERYQSGSLHRETSGAHLLLSRHGRRTGPPCRWEITV